MQREDTTAVLRRLITLAWPVVLAFMMQTGYNVVDIFWVGRLGAPAIAGVSLAGNFFYIILALGQVIGSGTVALVAHSFGARRINQANTIARQSLFLSFTVALFISLFVILFSMQIMRFLGGRDLVLTLSSGYLRIVGIGFFFQLLAFTVSYIFRGAGDMKTPMVIMIIASAMNVVLDPLLILGIGPFPRLEVQGAALATAAAQCVSLVVGLAILFRGRSGMKLTTSLSWRPDWTIVRKIFGVGIPVGISYMLMAASIMTIFGIVASFSEHALAALGISTRIFQFASLPVVGLSIATTTLVGQRLGARDDEGARRVGDTALRLSIGIMVFFVILFLMTAPGLLTLFTRDGQTIGYGVRLIHIVVFYLLFTGVTISLTGVFRGAGYTVPAMLAGIVKICLLYALAVVATRALKMGVTGVWWSMLVAYGIESAVMTYWYRRGTWRAKGLDLLRSIGPLKPA